MKKNGGFAKVGSKGPLFFHKNPLFSHVYWRFIGGILSSIRKHMILGYSAYIFSLLVCFRDYLFIMPAKRTVETPTKKEDVDESLLFSSWCVTDRRGLYIFEPGQPHSSNEDLKGEVMKMGLIVDVSYSGVYKIDGNKCGVIKLMVFSKGFAEENDTRRWYVVREIDFRDFSDTGFRHASLLTPNESPCMNVDRQLLMDWSAGVGGTKGAWFKNWYTKKVELLEASEPRPRRNREQQGSNEVPVVFGGQPATSSANQPNQIQPPPAPTLPVSAANAALPTFNRIPPNQFAQRGSSKCLCICLNFLVVFSSDMEV